MAFESRPVEIQLRGVTLVLGLNSEDVNNKADESNSRASDTAVLEPNEQEVI
jgi:hypothetical protein